MRFIVSTLTLAACLAVGMAEPTSQMWPPMNAEIAAFLAVKLANPETLLMPAAAAKVVAMIAENTAQAKDTITASGASSKGESVTRMGRGEGRWSVWGREPPAFLISQRNVVILFFSFLVYPFIHPSTYLQSVYCNGQYKKFLQCLVSGYEDSLQFDNDCVIEFFPTSGEFKDDCRGTGVA